MEQDAGAGLLNDPMRGRMRHLWRIDDDGNDDDDDGFNLFDFGEEMELLGGN
jgi:hypothetical protein